MRRRGLQSSNSFQSAGGKSICQKRGAGSINSMATAFWLAASAPTLTTRLCFSSPLPKCLIASSSLACTFITRRMSAPWAFTTKVWLTSDMKPSPSVGLRTCTRMRATTRWLRLVLVEALGDVVRGSGIQI